MSRRTFAQDEPRTHRYPGLLAKIMVQAANRLVIEAFGKQERIQEKFD
ncbi:hypothetical protein [Mycoplana sp. MJR14]|nr:hypothetical protein [Mycoplana sp. MJR14]MDF1632873.1 hypothetical protein [Mycoplana sp. MJR14]